MPDNQDKTHTQTQQATQPEQTKPISGQHQEQSSVTRLKKKQHSVFHSLLAVLVLVVVSAGTSNCGSKASKYTEPSKSLTNDVMLFFDKSVQEQLKKDADSGDSDAQALIAYCLMDGRCGSSMDRPQALTYAQQSAEAGNSDGMLNLGNMYEFGLGGPAKNEAEAVKWYKKSADAENSGAMLRLGNMYVLKDNLEEAIPWHRKAAKLGNKLAKFQLQRWGVSE
jgi:hypothetical protein